MKNRAKMISLLMAVCMMLTLLPAAAFAVDPYGDFTITGSDLSGVSFASGVLTISKGGTYTIKNDDPESSTDNRIVVDATDGTVALVFNGINIKSSDASALTIQAPTSISMEGSSNKLAVGSWDDCAAITNTSTTPVEIGGAGSMSVEGPWKEVGISGDLRLIGGSLTVFCSNGGTGIVGDVTVSGGSHTAYGGNAGNGIIGDVTVSGGSLTAYSSNSGTGIIGDATVSGGSLTAYSGNSGNGITGNATVSGGSLTAYSGGFGIGISGTLDISGGMAEVSGNGGSIGGIVNIDYSSGFNPQIRSGDSKSWGAKVNTTFTTGETITDRYVYIGPALCLISFEENAEHSEGIMDPLYIKHGETGELTPNAFTNDGYTFNGWNTKADGTGTAYADKATIQPTDDMTLYAQWKSNNAPTTYEKEYNYFIVTGPVNAAGDGVEGIKSTANGLDIKAAGEYTVKNANPSAAHSQMIKVCAEGVKLTLAGVNVDKNNDNALRLEADTNIVLENENTLDGNGNGISAEFNGKPKYTVTFSGSGSLTAVGTGNGIHGHAVIESGDVTCEGGGNGIQGNVTLKEGKLTCEGTGNGIEGTVIVNGGELNSTGKERDGICGNVEINGGSVYCEGKSNDAERSFDDLSRMNLNGGNGIEGNVTMSGGTLTAYSSANDAETNNYIEQGGFFPGLNGKLSFASGFNPSILAGKNPDTAASVSLPADGWIKDQYVTLGAGGSTPSVPTYYTVTFDPGEGSGTMAPVQVAAAGGNLVLPKNQFTAPAGKTFKCWSVNGKEWPELAHISVDGNITVTAVWVDSTTPIDPTPGGSGTPSHSHIDVWYIAGNSFGTSKSAVPTAVEIDGQPVSFTGDGREFTVSCIPAGAKWVTVRWHSTSVSTNFTPDANAHCNEIAIPKTGDASVICYALMAVIAAAGAMGKK